MIPHEGGRWIYSCRMKESHINDGWLDTISTDHRVIVDLRSEGYDPLLSLGKFHYDSATEPLAEQRHDDWLVLAYPLEGAQNYWINGEEVYLRAGQVLRIAPGSCYSTGEWPEQRGSLAWMILNVDPKTMKDGLGVDKSVFQLLADPDGARICPKPLLAKSLIQAIFKGWLLKDTPLQRELIRHQLATLILSTAASFESNAADSSVTHSTARVSTAIQWLDNHFREDITIDELVARSGVPTVRFFTEFKEQTGMTPNDYLLRGKVKGAANLLRSNPSLSITTIAHEMGFSSSQYFATVFRRYLGISPTEYREQK